MNEKFGSSVKKRKWLKVLIKTFSVVALIVFAVWLIYAIYFDSSIIGSWETCDGDHKAVLTFTQDGTALYEVNSMMLVTGSYEKKGNNKINIDIKANSQDIFTGEYDYVVVSSANGRKLELKYGDNNVDKYNQHKEEQGKLTVNKTLDSNLLGKWKNDERDLEYEFKNNSVAILKMKNKNITFKFKYSTQDGEITLLQNAGSKAGESKMSYSIDGDVITIKNVKFKDRDVVTAKDIKFKKVN